MDIPRSCLQGVGNSQRIPLSLLRNSESVHYSREIPRNCLLPLGNSQRMLLKLLRHLQRLSMTPRKFLENSPKVTEEFSEMKFPLRLLRNLHTLSTTKLQRIPPSLRWNPQKLSTSPAKFPENFPDTIEKFPEIVHLGNSKRISPSLPWNSHKLSMTPWKFQENAHEPIDKFPEIVHYLWEIPNEFPWAYWEIPRNSPLALCNLQRLHLSLLWNSYKLFTTPGKFEENSLCLVWHF